MHSSIPNIMRLTFRRTATAAVLALCVTVASCGDALNTEPQSSLSADDAIKDAATAQAALNGAYNALQSTNYYGLYMQVLGDLPADNAYWTGTFQYISDVSSNRMTADNSAATDMWTAIYRQIDRDNVVLQKVPGVSGLTDAAKNDILGQAYFLRALSFHNLAKFYGDVPTPLTPVSSPADAAAYTRTPIASVYTQILADLDKAGQLISNTTNTRYATQTAVKALRARVLFYRAALNASTSAADYQAALDAANSVLAGRDTLTVPYADLFSTTGTNTTEDIFRVSFITSQSNGLGNWYIASGRGEVSPTPELVNAYPAGDVRKTWSVRTTGNTNHPLEGRKYSTTAGTEHIHVIRLAELVLMKAEILARQGNLAAAVAEYNKVRIRAGIPKHTLGTDVKTADDVIAAIIAERRLELALEGDRWHDLNRLGTAAAVKGFTNRSYQARFPIPLRDIRTSPQLTQNPGY
jgi:hypothetical protein